MSRNGVARRFAVSIASAVRWMDEYLRTGRTAPKPRGGDRRSGRIEAQADLLMRAIEETPDITLMELREKLIAERGESFAISTLHAFYRRYEVTFKKRLPTPANKSAMLGSPSSPISIRQGWCSSTRLVFLDKTGATPTGGVLWYHTMFVHPPWAGRLEVSGIVGGHIFYRDTEHLN